MARITPNRRRGEIACCLWVLAATITLAHAAQAFEVQPIAWRIEFLEYACSQTIIDPPRSTLEDRRADAFAVLRRKAPSVLAYRALEHSVVPREAVLRDSLLAQLPPEIRAVVWESVNAQLVRDLYLPIWRECVEADIADPVKARLLILGSAPASSESQEARELTALTYIAQKVDPSSLHYLRQKDAALRAALTTCVDEV